MKKQAICIQCHNKPEQINLIIDTFPKEKFDFYIHIDSKANILEKIKRANNVVLTNKINVEWGKFSQVEATLEMFKLIESECYSYVHLISGNDFMAKSPEDIYNFFDSSNKQYIQSEKLPLKGSWSKGGLDRYQIYYPQWFIARPNKIFRRMLRVAYREVVLRTGWFKRKIYPVENFYGGSQWFSITGSCLGWMMSYLENNPEYIEFFSNALCSDEMFFQTLVRYSPYEKDLSETTLRYMNWLGTTGGPADISIVEIDNVINSNAMFARKFSDLNTIIALRNKLVKEIDR